MSWTDIKPTGEKAARTIVARTFVIFPDDTDPALVQAVIDAHDPSQKSAGELETERQEGKRQALPDWVKTFTYQDAANRRDEAVNGVPLEQALLTVDNAATLADIKVILKNIIRAVYDILSILKSIARLTLLLRDRREIL